MQITGLPKTANGNFQRRALLCLVILSIIAVASACSGYVGSGGWDGGIRAVGWIGKSDDGAFTMRFNIRGDKVSVAIIPLSLPCGEQTMYMFGDEPLRAELNENAFEARSEPGGLTPRLVIRGKYIDSTHAEGTWEMSAYGSYGLDVGCPAASGTWTGGPE